MSTRRTATNRNTLAQLYNDSLDWFEYVQFGLEFGPNSQTSLLKLDCARLRLSRWGQAMGLSDEADRSQPAVVLPTNSLLEAENSLRQVLELFTNAARAFQVNADGSRTGMLDIDDTTESNGLHDTIRTLALKRRNNSQLRPKVTWVLHKEEDFNKFMMMLIKHINTVASTISAVRRVQKDLCEQEVSELTTKGDLCVLLSIAAKLDKDLEEAISKALQSKEPGNPIGNSYSYYNCKIGGQVTGHGHSFQHVVQNATFH